MGVLFRGNSPESRRSGDDSTAAQPVRMLTRASTRNTSTLCVFFDGAFVRADIHARQLITQLQSHSDIIAPVYSEQSYDADEVLQATQKRVVQAIKRKKYRSILVIGASMGSINALRLAKWLHHNSPASLKVSVIGVDAALGRPALSRVRRATSPVIPRLPTGKAMDVVTHATNYVTWPPGLPFKRNTEPRIKRGNVLENLRAKRQFRPSAAFAMTASILDAPVFDTQDFADIDSVYIRSPKDRLLDGDAAEALWKTVFPQAPVVMRESGWHLSFVEHPQATRRAFERAIEELGL